MTNLDNLIPEFIANLETNNITVAFAESMTCGNVVKWLGSYSGISQYLKGSLVCYSLDSKIDILGLDEQEIKRYNGVSEYIAEAMAVSTQNVFKSDIGISITGYSEPSPSNNVFSPYFWIGVAGGGKAKAKSFDSDLMMARDEMIEYATEMAYTMANEFILNLKEEG